MSTEGLEHRLAGLLAARPLAPAVVLDVGWVNGLAAVRSLGRAGVPVVAVHPHRSALGFRSRYGIGAVAPDPAADPDGFVAFLAGLGDRLGRPAPLFPTHDAPLEAAARGRDALGGRFLYPFPDWEVLGRIQRKRFQLDTAVSAGVAVPETVSPGSAAEALRAGASLGYPVLVKPSAPAGFRERFGRQAFRCETAADLERAYGDAEPFEPMVQELIPGGDDALYTLGSYLAADGTALALFCGRKLRQTPSGIGTCRVGESIWVDEVVEQGLAFLSALGFHGISQVEFKRDPRDGRFKLMEVNPRLWKWHGLAAACGVDIPRIAYWDLLGARLEPVTTEGCRRRWAVTLVAGTRPVVPRLPYVDAVLALDDPGPAVTQVARLVRKALR